MAFIFVTNKRGAVSSTSGNSFMAVHKGNKDKNAKPQLSITISEPDMGKNRWVIGDRVDVAFDSENQKNVMICRKPKGSFAISSNHGASVIGKQIKGIIKFTLVDLPFIQGDKFECKNMEITKDGSIFTFE